MGEDGQVLVTYTSDYQSLRGKRLPVFHVSTFGAGRVVYFAAGVDKAMFFYPDGYLRSLIANACRWAAGDVPPPVEVNGPLILTTTFRRQPGKHRTIVPLLNHASSWGMHSTYQKLAPVSTELQKEYGHPDRSELRGTWPTREEIIPLHDLRVLYRLPGVAQARLQAEDLELPLKKTGGNVEVSVSRLEMHAMVVFE